MSIVVCEHGAIEAFISAEINGIKVRCRYCGEVIWEKGDMTIQDFRAVELSIYRLLGYSGLGMKLSRTMGIKEILKEETNEHPDVRTVKAMGPEALYRLEHDPNIKTTVTNRDMLLLHIDTALDKRDEVAFKALVKELEGVK